MGVCIETSVTSYRSKLKVVTPYMGVCIETKSQFRSRALQSSHPIWVCVLKQVVGVRLLLAGASHPIWVCVLKLHQAYLDEVVESVTPYMGVCIETDGTSRS